LESAGGFTKPVGAHRSWIPVVDTNANFCPVFDLLLQVCDTGTIKNLGAFATRNLESGEFIAEYCGEIISNKEMKERYVVCAVLLLLVCSASSYRPTFCLRMHFLACAAAFLLGQQWASEDL
jgi:hypothetical protein